jgi:hypothetical protein
MPELHNLDEFHATLLQKTRGIRLMPPPPFDITETPGYELAKHIWSVQQWQIDHLRKKIATFRRALNDL